MKECIAKHTNRCIWFTKENKDELLKIELPEIYDTSREFQIRETDEYICVDFCGVYKTFYYYNNWYVEEEHDYEYPRFYKYTDEEFKEIYDLCK